jgi:Flp pilus assembly secretin CpaC
LQAIDHLEAAGMQAEADQLRRQCTGQMKAVVNQLKTAEAQLARLQQAAYTKPVGDEWRAAASSLQKKAVKVEVQMIEVNRTKCRALGFDFAKFDSNDRAVYSSFGALCVDGNPALPIFLDALQKEGLLKVLSRPTVVTRSGQTACVECTQEVPVVLPQDDKVAIEYKKVGSQLEILPMVLENGKVQLSIHSQFSEIADAGNGQPSRQQLPIINMREATFTVELQSGQTAVQGGLITKRVQAGANPTAACLADGSSCADQCACQQAVKNSDEVELFIVVHPEIVETENTAAVVNHPRQPVVTAALPAGTGTAWPPAAGSGEHSHFATQAAYFAPVDNSSKPADSFAKPADEFDGPALPAPFVPQPVTIEPSKAFAEPGAGWSVKPAPEPFTESPVMLDSWIFTPDKR